MEAPNAFDAVADNLSMTKAAEEVHQSKGSISYQVGKREAEFGFRFFKRAHAKLERTEHGHRSLLGLVAR